MNTEPFIGLPYQDMGRDYNGVDCWGLVYLVYRDVLGITIPTYAEGCTAPFERAQRASVVTNCITDWSRRDPGAEQVGDAVLMRMMGHLCHVGVLAPNGLILHSEEGRNTILEERSSANLAHRIEGFYWYDPGH